MLNKKIIVLGALLLTLSLSPTLGLTKRAAKAAWCQKMSIPAYFYPGALWNQATASSPTVSLMTMNPASGPGTAPNSDYVTAVLNAQLAGIKVIGYVHTSYGARDAMVVKAEIDAFKNWYAVDGIFLDEVATDLATLPYYQDLANYIRASAGTFVMLNPGTIPAQEYLSVGDSVVIFEGTYATYKNWVKPSWAGAYPPEKMTHLVYATATSANMRNAVRLSRQRNAGNVYITPDVLPNPWDTLPSYWTSEINELKKCGV